MTSCSSKAQLNLKRGNRLWRRCFVDLPDSGSAFFLRAALLTSLALGGNWFLQRNDSHPPDFSFFATIGGSLVGLFLLLSLCFYIWERSLRRKLRERIIARHGATANHNNIA